MKKPNLLIRPFRSVQMIPVFHFHLKVEIFSFYQKILVLRYDIMGQYKGGNQCYKN